MDVAQDIPGLRSMDLPTKPDCPIKYTITSLSPSDEPPSSTILIVFVNGLGLPQASWQPTLQLLQADFAAASTTSAGTKNPGIHAVTYDRYGQGLSQPQHGAKPTPHDLLDAVADLSAFLDGVKSQLHLPDNAKPTRLFLVAHSIGVPLSRLYAERHPGAVAALLALDSNMANSDFVSLYPDPDSPAGFDPARDLPPDTTQDQLRAARRFAQAMFHPSAPNGENLDRSTLPALLPLSDGPVLIGDSNEGKLLLQVVGHDPETFAEESLKVSPRGLTERYVRPAWERYNEGLLSIAGAAADSRKKVVIAPGCGHFIQKNNPRFVADEVIAMVKALCDGRA